MTVVVLDTNVYVSALVFRGQPYAALERALLPPFVIAVSAEIRDELVGTLTERFGWEQGRAEAVCERLWESARWCEPIAVQASRDPDDDHVLGCALAAGAATIVTGDKDLLALHPFQGVAVVTPDAFLRMALA